jgi:choline dehydrogenase-like flavoprotein
MGGSLEEQGVETGELTAAELRLARVLRFLAFAFAGMAISYVVQGVVGNGEFPFVANSLAKDGIFAALCVCAASDVRRYSWAVRVVIGGHILIIAGLLAMVADKDDHSVKGSFEGISWLPDVDGSVIYWVWLALAILVTVVLMRLLTQALRSRYRLRFLSQDQHRTVMAMAEILVEAEPGEIELLTPGEIARNVDDYLADIDAIQKKKVGWALTAATFYPLLRLHPPLAVMSAAKRKEFVERCFFNDVVERRLPGFLRKLVQSVFVACQQVVYIGYWSDPRTYAAAGYVPFTKRPRYEDAMRRVVHNRPTVQARGPRDIDGVEHRAEVVVVGSGAAGATIAQRLVEAGRKVTLLERGRHVEPSQFTENERQQFSDLYHDGAIQTSVDARFQVLQGQCVGGTTVVNNAVCFDLPEDTLKRWNEPGGLDAGLDPGRLAQAFARLRSALPVRSQGNGAAPLQAGAAKFAAGVEKLGLDQPPNRYDVVEANIEGCLGCGYCNYGCKYGKKLSMLDGVIPETQRDHPDMLEVIAECDVRAVETNDGQATGVRCRLGDGRELRILADSVVVSAGAMASSTLLQRSGIGGKLAGSCVSFNMGAPMTAEFDERLDSYDGLQITHGLRPAGEPGLILETWFNPVGAQALFMPGWFADHWRNMRHYDRMACVGSVVGTRSNARVSNGRFMQPGTKYKYTPHPDDLAQLVRGLVLIGKIMFAAGAKRVMPSTFRSLAYAPGDDIDELEHAVRDNTDITVHSSHPQGGNPVSRDPAKGVVGPDFRVHGYPNLHVVDASVFPSSITVNPQLTVMALADIAADSMI